MNAPIALGTSKIQTALYLQDTWKITRKLTLDYGVRWDHGTYQSEQYGRVADFSATTPNPSAAGRLGARVYEATCNCKFANAYPYAIGPRLGVAYQIDSKTVIRAVLAWFTTPRRTRSALPRTARPPVRRPSGRSSDFCRTASRPASTPCGRRSIPPPVRPREPSWPHPPCSIRTRAARRACCNTTSIFSANSAAIWW